MNTLLNPHYDFKSEENCAYINTITTYSNAFINTDLDTLKKAEKKALEGVNGYGIGVNVRSPWGDNKVLEAHIGEFGKNEDIVKKEITVKPGFMLSLQRHRGREELWEVTSGTLTVIFDGQVYTVKTGGNFKLPKGSVHCMINRDEEPVTVIETQTGICREADNVRLLDFNNRPTMPLSSKNEALSAIIYTEAHQEIEQKFGCEEKPNMVLLLPKFKKIINNME